VLAELESLDKQICGKPLDVPIKIDCFDGMAVSWAIGTSPDAELVNTMLDDAIASLQHRERPIVHTDRGCHYRWPGWVSWMKEAGLTRSMPKKGCSPNNAARERFFGRIKNEMFYGRPRPASLSGRIGQPPALARAIARLARLCHHSFHSPAPSLVRFYRPTTQPTRLPITHSTQPFPQTRPAPAGSRPASPMRPGCT
jgi:transposase InsO family protein